MQVSFDQIRVKSKADASGTMLFDPARGKWVVQTPEEQVRQLWIHHLIQNKKISKSKIAVEKGVPWNQTVIRFDICIYNEHLQPDILIECKAPSVKIDSPVLEQILKYNQSLGARQFILTNGLIHHGFEISNNQITKLDVY